MRYALLLLPLALAIGGCQIDATETPADARPPIDGAVDGPSDAVVVDPDGGLPDLTTPDQMPSDTGRGDAAARDALPPDAAVDAVVDAIVEETPDAFIDRDMALHPDAAPDMAGAPDAEREPDLSAPDAALDAALPDVMPPDVMPPDAMLPDVMLPDAEVDASALCGPGVVACGGECVDLLGDPDNCGACGVVCGPGSDCGGGTCVEYGCADGEREGFVALGDFPEVAACSGGFAVPGAQHVVPACGRSGGDDGPLPAGAGCNLQDLCAPGWSVCEDVVDFEAHLPPDADCDDLTPFVGGDPTFISRQRGSDAVGLDCDGQGTNDLFGCGRPPMNLRASCGAFDKVISGGEAAPWQLGPRAAFNITEWQTVSKPGPERGGVLCCRRGPGVCPDGFGFCFDDCVDLQADAEHCGACGQVCPDDQICVDGGCVCPPGLLACDGACVDPASPEHCGGCGNVCGADRLCVDGACACPDGLTDCDWACVDLEAADDHCGACGVVCGEGAGCYEGACIDLGCADGEREGFADLQRFPDVAACSGGFAVAGMDHVTPSCGFAGGDDGPRPDGAGCNIQDLCAPGWAVCDDVAEFEAALPADADCGDLDPTVGDRPTFVSRQRGSDVVGLECDGQGSNDLFGCGLPPMALRATCGAFDKAIAGGDGPPWELGERAAFNITEWQVARKPGPERGGVLCCRRAPRVCPEGTDACADRCVDYASDRAHCGGCGNACAAGQGCFDGVCGVVGCADGEREGFADVGTYTRIAGCSGGFQVAGLSHRAPACDRAGGDDGARAAGVGCNIQDLCAEGWHVCDDAADVAASLPAGDDCGSVAPTFAGRSMFLSRQRGSNQVGLSCDGLGTNDIFGCGTPPTALRADCGVLDRQMGSGEAAPWSLGPRAAGNITEWEAVTKSGPEAGGVLCCRDALGPPDGLD